MKRLRTPSLKEKAVCTGRAYRGFSVASLGQSRPVPPVQTGRGVAREAALM